MAERVRRSNAKVFAAYLAFQAVVGIGFWVALATSAGLRELFELRPTLPAVTDAFFLADLIIGVAGSWIELTFTSDTTPTTSRHAFAAPCPTTG